jgi:nucleotide-binding universal stress UspA family protein
VVTYQLFGRTLPRLFQEAVREKVYRLEEPASLSQILKREADKKYSVPWVHHFGYLRGLDGDLSGSGNGKIDDSAKKSLVKVAQTEGLTQLEPAVGTSQFDYLRRLIQRIKHLDQELQEKDQGSIRAFGILGTDVYDKLLILQALKDEFPHYIFFTTDLDARYLSPKHYKWTRNLIIAAPFGLELSPGLQTMVPPFRSSYQTSLYLAVKTAMGSLKELAITHGLRDAKRYVDSGSAKSVIVKLAEDIEADLIVLGSHGRHGLQLLLGDTANGVLHRAPCDVLAVRIGARTA